MSEQLEPDLSAAEALRLQLVADCDQRWAGAREWLWDQEAPILMDLDRLLTGPPATLLAAMRDDSAVALVVQNLAALAIDELLARVHAADPEAAAREAQRE